MKQISLYLLLSFSIGAHLQAHQQPNTAQIEQDLSRLAGAQASEMRPCRFEDGKYHVCTLCLRNGATVAGAYGYLCAQCIQRNQELWAVGNFSFIKPHETEPRNLAEFIAHLAHNSTQQKAADAQRQEVLAAQAQAEIERRKQFHRDVFGEDPKRTRNPLFEI